MAEVELLPLPKISPSELVLLLSLLALIGTKIADFVTTIRHVGPQTELNPFARRLFDRFGFGVGLAIVGPIWLAVVFATYAAASCQLSELYRWLTSAIGFVISLAQWEAARFNSGGSLGRMTAIFLSHYRRWTSLWRSGE